MVKKLHLKEIVTQRFSIKKMTPSMVNDKYLAWFEDPTIKKFIENIPKNIDVLKKYVKKTIKKNDVLFYGIYCKKNHIGNIKFENINCNKSSAYLGVIIGDRTWRHKGVAFEVIEKMMSVFYEHFGVFKFYLGVNKKNTNAIKLYKKLGFKIVPDRKSKNNLKMFFDFLNAKIIIGTAQFGLNYGINNFEGKLPLSQIKKIKNLADKNYIRTFETAQSYGDAEIKLGKLNLKNFEIITKLKSLNQKFNKTKIHNQIRTSLKRLNQTKINAILVHDAKDLIGKDGLKIFNLLNFYKKKGIFKNLGVVVYNLDELKQLTKKFKFDIISIPCNIFDTRFLNSKIIKSLKNLNTKIYARSIFLQGLLLMKTKKISKNFLSWKKEFLKFNHMSKKEKISKTKICTKFVVKNHLIDKVIIGFDNFKQFKEITTIKYNQNLKLNYKFKTNNQKLINPSKW